MGAVRRENTQRKRVRDHQTTGPLASPKRGPPPQKKGKNITKRPRRDPGPGPLPTQEAENIEPGKRPFSLKGLSKTKGAAISRWLFEKASKSNWKSITSDEEILQSVTGLHIPVEVVSDEEKKGYPVNSKTEAFLSEEINKLLDKKVIERCQHEIGEYISPTFVTEKQDGGHRFILNLKELNKEVDKKKFKMQTLKSILCLIRPNCYMAKLDIKDAYYSVPIHQDSRKLLRFLHKGVLYQFRALPNGYTEGPRKFTKLMKAPLAQLRKLLSLIHI